MLVRLHQACFEGGDLIALMTLVGVCRARGHALVIDPPDWRSRPEHALHGWLSVIDPDAAQSVRDFLRASQAQASRLPGGTLVVTVEPLAESQWSRALLTIGDATLLLMAPLRLLVENERSDLSFLRRLVPQNYRRQLDSALEQGELEAYHAGGISATSTTFSAERWRSALGTSRRSTRVRISTPRASSRSTSEVPRSKSARVSSSSQSFSVCEHHGAPQHLRAAQYHATPAIACGDP